jgi:hypothetical protein
MNKKHVLFSLILSFAVITLTLSSCKKEEAASPLKLVSLMAGDIDLNGATSPNTVPVEPSIVATFNTDVDAATAIAANIILKQDYDGQDIELVLAVSGKTITITTVNPLGNGALFELSFGAGLMSGAGLANTAFARTFTTVGAFVPAGVVAYWNFEDNADDQVGSWNPTANGIVDITYAASRKTAAGKAASFNGTTSIIEYANGDALIDTKDFTLSFWVKATEAGHGHFIIGLGAFYGFQFEMNADFKGFKMPVQFEFGDGTTGTGGDLFYNGDGKTKDNTGFAGTTFSKENTAIDAILKDKWAHITYVYNSTSKERMFFLNGELVQKQDHNLWPLIAGAPDPVTTIVGLKYGGTAPEVVNELAFGFIQSRAGTLWDTETWGGYDFATANHFKGELDDVRIFHKALTETEVGLMYNSEKP